jgi:hypothetical protein
LSLSFSRTSRCDDEDSGGGAEAEAMRQDDCAPLFTVVAPKNKPSCVPFACLPPRVLPCLAATRLALPRHRRDLKKIYYRFKDSNSAPAKKNMLEVGGGLAITKVKTRAPKTCRVPRKVAK